MSDKEYLKAMAAHYRQFPVPELAAHADRLAAIAEAMSDMQEQWAVEGENWEWSVKFEIGGVSVQKVFHSRPPPQLPLTEKRITESPGALLATPYFWLFKMWFALLRAHTESFERKTLMDKDVERAARDAGGVAYQNRFVDGVAFAFGPESLARLVAWVRADEREKCAQVGMMVATNGIETAAAIRSGGKS